MIHRILLTVILEVIYLSAKLCSYTEGTDELSELGTITVCVCVCVCVLNGGKEGHSALYHCKGFLVKLCPHSPCPP